MVRSILHCDMNCFYASVEIQKNPKLRKCPVAVGGSVESRHGIILAKNYAAKAYGVETGEAIWQAKQKCRDLVVVPPDYDAYLRYSRLAREIYGRYTDRVEPYGMDECWLDLTGTEGINGPPEHVASLICEAVRFELGLTLSVGVSFNKIFAKLGSDMKKPDAMTVIPFDGYKEIVWSLPVGDLLGVGRSTLRTLAKYNAKTIGDLARLDTSWLQREFGVRGIMLSRFANGADNSPVHVEGYAEPVKSVGHGITTTADLNTNQDVWEVILELTQDVSHRLRLHRKMARGVAVYVRDNGLESRQWQMTFDFPTQSAKLIAVAAGNLFRQRYDWRHPIRAVTVQAINLVEQDAPIQRSLFVDQSYLDRLERLELCIEDIRSRFGKNAIRNAVLCKDLPLPPDHTPVVMPTGVFA